MKPKVPKARNLVHLAMLRQARNTVHGKTHKQQRSTQRSVLRRSLKDEGVSVQHTLAC